MSERSIYFRDQALKCTKHAETVDYPEMQAVLLKMAGQSVAQAVAIETKEKL